MIFFFLIDFLCGLYSVLFNIFSLVGIASLTCLSYDVSCDSKIVKRINFLLINDYYVHFICFVKSYKINFHHIFLKVLRVYGLLIKDHYMAYITYLIYFGSFRHFGIFISTTFLK